MKSLLTLTVILTAFVCCTAQHIAPDITQKRWKALWIAVPGESPTEYGVYNFRKPINVSTRPSTFIIHVSADNRYKLFVNGKLASLGPARGDLFHWNFETVDIAPFLQEGENIVSAIVWNCGKQKPEAQISKRTAFIMQGNTENESAINTDKTWRCIKDSSYTALAPELLYTYYVSGPGEMVDYNKHSDLWQHLTFNDKSWKDAQELFHGLPKGIFDWSDGWMLVPRTIPAMELTQERLGTVREAIGINLPKDFPAIKKPITVPANTKAKILLDQSHLTNAYPIVEFSKGKNATITLRYAEALYITENTSDWKAQKQKGNRNDIKDKRFVGVADQIISSGTDHQNFTPLSWRTFRYIQLEVETSKEQLVIEDLYGIFTGYPFENKSEFKSVDPALSKILEVGWRTARLCAVETYMDCPYYEQLQYIGDTRIQALVTLFNSGDDRLVRNAINQLDYSRMAEGITLSRYPTANPQQIPMFSLWWIGMLHDYWMYRPDDSFVKNRLPGARLVLNFFKGYQQEDGSLRNAPYWLFTDWAEGNGWERGVPPLGNDGTSAVLDLQLCLAYQVAASMEESIGMKEYAEIYRANAELLKETIRKKYWDDQKLLFADTEEKKYFSQHANTLAILAGVVADTAATKLMEKIVTDKTLTQATIYFKYYVHQALNKSGLGNQYLDLLQDWRDQLDNGLTTWAEISDHNNARSDCHAWGASPNIEFYRIVLGIESAAPGFNQITIKPNLGKLKQVAGTMPHPNGTIQVNYTLTKDKLKAEITTPPNTTSKFYWKGKEHELKPGIKNTLNL
jgi:hypothetical protein